MYYIFQGSSYSKREDGTNVDRAVTVAVTVSPPAPWPASPVTTALNTLLEKTKIVNSARYITNKVITKQREEEEKHPVFCCGYRKALNLEAAV